MYDQAWEETLLAMPKEPERDLLESLHHDDQKKSSLIKNASALSHSDLVHRKEPKSYTKLKSLGTDFLEDQLQGTRIAQRERGSVEDEAIPVVPERDRR